MQNRTHIDFYNNDGRYRRKTFGLENTLGRCFFFIRECALFRKHVKRLYFKLVKNAQGRRDLNVKDISKTHVPLALTKRHTAQIDSHGDRPTIAHILHKEGL